MFNVVLCMVWALTKSGIRIFSIRESGQLIQGFRYLNVRGDTQSGPSIGVKDLAHHTYEYIL